MFKEHDVDEHFEAGRIVSPHFTNTSPDSPFRVATFFLGDSEFGLELSRLREAIDEPGEIIRVPLTAEYCEGIFNLRGEIVPLISLHSLLNISPCEYSENKVIIVDLGGRSIGLRIDTTGSVLKYKSEEISQVLESGEQLMVVSAVVRDELRRGGFLQVLDPERLLRLPGVPGLCDDRAGRNDRKDGRSRKVRSERFIRFTVAGHGFALPVDTVVEIQQLGLVNPAQVTLAPFFRGLISSRKKLIPLLDLRTLLKLGGEMSSSGHLLVIQSPVGVFALLADEVNEFVDVSEDERLNVPLVAGGDEARLFDHLLVKANVSRSLAINLSTLISINNIDRLMGSVAQLQLAASGQSGAGLGGGRAVKAEVPPILKEPLLVFRMKNRFALSLKEVQEVVSYPVELMDVPGRPPHVMGMLYLRGQLAPVIDLSAVLWGKAFEKDSGSILLLRGETGLIGVLVESVDEILKLQPGRFSELPSRLSGISSGFPVGSVLHTISTSLEGEEVPVVVLSLITLLSGLKEVEAAREEAVL